ncbi:MAG: RagB/SusD family nutrient uptake outer membrane protein [Paludibacteraceae bacterium]|nr:RagB/SusD family nutrient uptake outer membrane protein [Paludibacteraceae bacterium]
MKTFKYIAIAAVAMAFTACDFFDSKSPSAMDAAQVFSNPNSTEQVIAGVYEQFGQDKSFRNRLACGYQGMNTDVEFGNKNSGRAEWNIYAMTPTSGDLSTANGKDPWGYLNSAIERCNNIIEGIEEFGDTVLTDDAKKKEEVLKMRYMLGEAYFLRSFCYLQMVQLWGDVPARFTSIAKDEAGMKTKKSDRTNVLAQLRIDLKKAAELMPWSSECPGTAANYTGRPSKAAAYALLARVDLMYAGKGVRPESWKNGPVFLVDDASLRQELNTEVMWACSQILNKSDETAKFQTKYEDIFKKICADETNYYNSEVFWEIAFADGSRGQVLQYNCTKMDKAIGGLKNNVGGSSNSSVGIVPTLYYDFEAADARRDVTMARYIWVYDDGSEFNSDPAKVKQAFPQVDVANKEKFLYQKQNMIGSWYGNKYRVEWMKRDRTGNDDGVNFPIIRYADVLLMAAEASIGGIGGDVPANLYGVDGKACFDKVRTRAGVSTKPLTMANIQEERKLEFTGEYLRKYDLMRWGILKETLENAHERLANMRAHTGEFAGLQDTLYIKYKYVGDEYSSSASIKGFVIDSVYGLNKDELGQPSYYDPDNGWRKGNLYKGSSGEQLAPDNYMLFDREYPERLNGRQYWPIFSVNVGQSEGALWNDYDYTDTGE